jgi:hypothetical protein
MPRDCAEMPNTKRLNWDRTVFNYSDYIEFPHDVLSYDNFYVKEETKN